MESNTVTRYLGVIEGFYGRPWSFEARADYANFLPQAGLNSYIYAPKSDAKLRRDWRKPWSDAELSALQRCCEKFRASGVQVGFGLSPVGISDAARRGRFDRADQLALQRKLEQIAILSDDFLCLLFDDIPTTGRDMAVWQLHLCDTVRSFGTAQRLIVCPSYYSSDPRLEQLFGERPPHYWRQLGEGLDSDIDFFWTGEAVCSKHYSEDNLHFIAEQLRRRPVLWDNYPVNDGAMSSQYLQLRPFAAAGFLSQLTAGHFSNPMNQPYLSQIPLSSLAPLYGGEAASVSGEVELQWQAFMQRQLGRDLAAQLGEDVALFQDDGLASLSAAQRQALSARYRQHDHRCAKEIVDWLEGRYAFDPACLTG